MGEFLLPLSAFINFVANNINITLLNFTEIEKIQINMKRLDEMG